MSSVAKPLIVLAIGGNSLIKDPKHASVADQYQQCVETCRSVAALVSQGYRVVVTHGNGPQVGFILRRAECAAHELHRVPLDSCVADTQGAIGYNIQMAMDNLTRGWDRPAQVVTVVTQVLVDREDPAFESPSKPIGSFLDQADAMKRRDQDGWHVVEDAGRGYRRVVASPIPKRIVEIEAIRHLSQHGFLVVCCGGGGIPVMQDARGELLGVEAVIDKDRASSVLANDLGADMLLISTAVEKVSLNYKKPDERALDHMTVAEARKYMAEGHFAPGSMLPKIEAVLDFLDQGGKLGLITDPDHLLEAVEGKTGTRIVAS